MILEKTGQNTDNSRLTEASHVIGANLRALRKASGLSQKQIARLFGVTFQQVQKYERGANRLPVENLYLMKAHINVPYASFFEGLHTGETTGWPEAVTERLRKVKDPDLREKIERVVMVMAE